MNRLVLPIALAALLAAPAFAEDVTVTIAGVEARGGDSRRGAWGGGIDQNGVADREDIRGHRLLRSNLDRPLREARDAFEDFLKRND